MASRRERTLSVNIVSDIRDLKRSLGQVEASTRNTSQKLTNAGRAIQAGFAIVAVSALKDVATEMFNLGVQADSIRDRFGTVFGDMSDEMADWADDVNERFGASVEQVQNMANEIGDLLVPIGFTREETAKLTKEVLETANALSEWTGGQVSAADAAERIRKALLGERESLEALGVKVLQSDVNARLAAEGQAQLTGEAKAQAEALATLNIIQGKSTDALDAYARGANEAFIEQKAMTAAMLDARQTVADLTQQELEPFQEILVAAAFAAGDLVEFLNDLTGASEDAEEGTESLSQRWLEALPIIGDDIRRVRELSEEYLENKRVTKEVEEAQRNLDSARHAATGSQREQRDAVNETSAAYDALLAAMSQTQDEIRAQTDPVFALRQANDKLNEAFEKRVRLQADGASASEVNAAIADELKAVQDLEFAQQNANDALEPGLELIDRYGERVAIQTEALRLFKEEILGIDSAIRGLPSEVRLPGVSNPGAIRNLEEELARRSRGTVIE